LAVAKADLQDMKDGLIEKDKSIEALKWEITTVSGARLAASWEHRQSVSQLAETHHPVASPLHKSWNLNASIIGFSKKHAKKYASSTQFFRENTAAQANLS
jgi:hypothetical protein